MQRQLDIFENSREVALRNDRARALLAEEPDAARQVARTLPAEFGTDPLQAPADLLIEHLQGRQALPAPVRLDASEVLDARQRLEGPVAAAAAAVLGANASG